MSQIKKLLLVTDAWEPQVNGVVRTLKNTIANLEVLGIETRVISPLLFFTIPCPSYPEIRLSITSRKKVENLFYKDKFDALHIATEGPLGLLAKKIAKKNKIPHTSAYHTRFPEYVHARMKLPVSISYFFLRNFHKNSSSVLVPSNSIIAELEKRKFKNAKFWTRGVDHSIFKTVDEKKINKTNPIFLCTGRLAVEKNLEAFLSLKLPGEKWVAGEGPQGEYLKKKYPNVKFFGVMPQSELAILYRKADIFVFPSLTDTFGLVMVEAMACGLPVAAFPVPGPQDVVSQNISGVLDEDLRVACLKALDLKPQDAIKRSKEFTWKIATDQFHSYLTKI